MRTEHANGDPIVDIAHRYAVPYFTTYEIIRGWTYKHVGGPRAERQRPKLTEAKRRRILRLKEDGVTLKRISQDVGLGLTTVKKAIKESK